MKSIGKKMLAWVLSILLIAGCCLVAGMPKDTVSAAETYTSGDYEYQIEGGYATITGYVGTSRSVVIPASLNGYPVSGIGGSAFDGNVSISSVIIPKSVTFLGVYAFRNCTALRTVEIQSGTVTFGNYYGSYDTFAGCTSLQSVKLAKGITEIAPYMFRDCESLREIEIPNTVSVIGTNAFLNCKNLTSIAIPSSVTAIDGSAFQSCKALRTVTLSEGLSRIEQGAFLDCSSLDSIVIPKTVTFLGVYAFRNCTALRTVEIQSGTVTFGNYYGSYDTFAGCTSLQSVKLAKGITEIAPYMFRDCESLREIEIPNTVSVIGTNAFLNCKNLTSIAIPSSVTAIDGSAFESCKALRTVTLSEGLSRIEQEAFQDCSSLDSIVIPKTVTFLGAYAFRNCTALRTVEIQSGMVTFDNYYGSFAGCTSLQSVKLAEGITEIAPDMFQDCMALRKISIPSSVYIIGDVRDSSGDLTDRTFNDCKGILTIYGEAGSFAQKYANANGIRFSTAEYTPYVDVADSGVYYRDAVEFVSNQGLMTGLNPTTFAPAENLSRAQFAVILYRMTGSPSTAGMNNPFGDNQPGTFYYDAVIWCNNAGIITGYYNPDGSFTGRFGPSDNISREQLATMLYRYANYVGDNTSAATSLNRFGDAAMVSSYAVDALEWAAAEGIVSGRATNPPTIAPQDNASRADVAVMLQRYLV